MTSILVVDDDADVLTVRKMTPENKGHHVHVFTEPVLVLKNQGRWGCRIQNCNFRHNNAKDHASRTIKVPQESAAQLDFSDNVVNASS